MNDSVIKLIGAGTKMLLQLLAVVFVVWILMNGDPKEELNYNDQPIDYGIWISYVAIVIAVAMALIMGIVFIFLNVKKAIPRLAAIAGLGIVALAGYMIASGSTAEFANIQSNIEVTESVSKWSGFVLQTFYILFFITLLAVVFSVVRGAIVKLR